MFSYLTQGQKIMAIKVKLSNIVKLLYDLVTIIKLHDQIYKFRMLVGLPTNRLEILEFNQ